MAVESPTVESRPARAAALSQPLYGATIGQAITRFFRKYATFPVARAAASSGGSTSYTWSWALRSSSH